MNECFALELSLTDTNLCRFRSVMGWVFSYFFRSETGWVFHLTTLWVCSCFTVVLFNLLTWKVSSFFLNFPANELLDLKNFSPGVDRDNYTITFPQHPCVILNALEVGITQNFAFSLIKAQSCVEFLCPSVKEHLTQESLKINKYEASNFRATLVLV